MWLLSQKHLLLYLWLTYYNTQLRSIHKIQLKMYPRKTWICSALACVKRISFLRIMNAQRPHMIKSSPLKYLRVIAQQLRIFYRAKMYFCTRIRKHFCISIWCQTCLAVFPWINIYSLFTQQLRRAILQGNYRNFWKVNKSRNLLHFCYHPLCATTMLSREVG